MKVRDEENDGITDLKMIYSNVYRNNILCRGNMFLNCMNYNYSSNKLFRFHFNC